MSPAATLTPEQAADATLEAADRLFYTRGVTDVTMAEIRDGARVSLRRLYSLYPSKADLIAGWLRHRHETWMDEFVHRIDDGLSAGSAPVDAVFDALEAWMTETSFRGCGFINTHAETGALTDAHREIIRDHKRAVADHVETVTAGGQALAVLIDGAIVQAAIFESTDPIDAARELARLATVSTAS